MIRNMRFMYACLCFAAVVRTAWPAPANGFVFPDERRQRNVDIITPPVLPILEHLERDPSTLLPSERQSPKSGVRPRFGFGGGFNVSPSKGGLTASISSSASGAGASQSASQSFSFGFNEGFSASQSASQAASFNGFGSNFSGSQASSQAASFNGGSVSGAASSASAFGGGSASQSASSAFGFNNNGFNGNGFNGNGFNGNGFDSAGNEPSDATFVEAVLDARQRVPSNFPFPQFPKEFTTGAFRSSRFRPSGRSRDASSRDTIVTALVGNF